MDLIKVGYGVFILYVLPIMGNEVLSKGGYSQRAYAVK